MSLYETGTITGALAASTIAGTGTKWTDAKVGITNGSVLFVSSAGGVDGVYQVNRVISDTSIELTQPIYKAFTNSSYSVLVAEADSTASWANKLAASLRYYQGQLDSWQQVMTGTGDVILTTPDGKQVTIKSFTKMGSELDVKLAHRRYTLNAPAGSVTGKLYPIILNNLFMNSYLAISTRSSVGSDPMNNCGFIGNVIAAGWTDRRLQVSGSFTQYDVKERAIHSIYGGSEWADFCAVYVDGGAFPLTITVDEGVTITVPTANATVNTTVFLWGTTTPEQGTKIAQLANFNGGTGFYHFGGGIFEGNKKTLYDGFTNATFDNNLKMIGTSGQATFSVQNHVKAATDPAGMLAIGIPTDTRRAFIFQGRHDNNATGSVVNFFPSLSGEFIVRNAHNLNLANGNFNNYINTQFTSFISGGTANGTLNGPNVGYGNMMVIGTGQIGKVGDYTTQVVFDKSSAIPYLRCMNDNTAASFTTWQKVTVAPISDENMKTIRGDLNVEGALDNINRMEFKIFAFNNDETQRYRRGVISQQIKKIDKDYVSQVADHLCLDPTPMMLDGLAAIKALRARDEGNKERISKLEGEVQELKRLIATIMEK